MCNNPGHAPRTLKYLEIWFLAVVFLLLQTPAFSQDKPPITFGKISPADFDLPKSAVIDSNTNAVIVADIGSTSFVGNRKGWFSYVFKRRTRIKILNKKGFDAATVAERLYVNHDDKEELNDVAGSTYNLENGKIVETKLAKNEVFEDKIDKNHFEKKFS